MPNVPHRNTLAAIFICLSIFSYSQNLTLSYQNPPPLNVCDTAEFAITVANTLSDTITSLSVTASLPAGISYSPGSVANAQEVNIADPNHPVFGLADVPPGSLVIFTFRALTLCDLVSSINTGSLFTNTYTANYAGGSKTITTTPYIIETALLQPLSLSNATVNGTVGQTFTRQWTLTNTRLGTISSLTFIDDYTAGIIVSSDIGTIVTDTAGHLEIQLTGADFANIGDGDEWFELNEQIVITEQVLIISCGVTIQAKSNLMARWGCHGSACQTLAASATVNITPANNNPDVKAFISTPFPTDYCPPGGQVQRLTLVNTGNLPATSISLGIYHGNKNLMGFQPSSVHVLVNGISVAIDAPYLSGVVQFEGCATPDNLYDAMVLIIPLLDPGDTAVVEWEIFLCAAGCTTKPPEWKYGFLYKKFCPQGATGSGSGSSASPDISLPIKQEIEYFIGQFLTDGNQYKLTYTLKSPYLIDFIGNLVVDFELPCGIEWGDNDGFAIAGNPPDSVTITDKGPEDGSEVLLYFTLPFGVDSVGADYYLLFTCDTNCFKIDCILDIISSCLPNSTDPKGALISLQLNANTTVLPLNAYCGPKVCEVYDLKGVCGAPNDSICPKVILGYFLHTMDFRRENYGLPDNDDDRLPDPTGELDFDFVWQNRALTGDTLQTKVNAVMHMDDPTYQLSNAIVEVNFESHLADDGLNGGAAIDFLTDRELMMHESGIVNLGGRVRIKDASTGQVFQCELPEPIAIDTQHQKIVIANTRPEQVLDEWLYLNYTYHISAQLLIQQGCNIPPDWKFEDGDSLLVDVYHKIVYNIAIDHVKNLRTSTAVGAFDVDVPPQLSPFFCKDRFRYWQLSGYEVGITPWVYNVPACSVSNELGGDTLTFRLAAANFFPFEFRNFVTLKTWQTSVWEEAAIVESKLLSYRLQDSPVLASDVPLSWTQSGGDYIFDLDALNLPEPDEGFSMTFNQTWQLPCNITSALDVSLEAFLDWVPSIPNPKPAFAQVGNGVLIPRWPNLSLIPGNTNIISITDEALWEFVLINYSNTGKTAFNAWLTISSENGFLTDITLLNTITGNIITPVNGLYQLGDLPPGWTSLFQLIANITACESDALLLHYGWNCTPMTTPSDPACKDASVEFRVQPLLGELELDISSPTGSFDLCDTIPYHTVEIFNAQYGPVYDLLLEAQLPEGFHVLPGSCELAYPSNDPYQPVSDPEDLGNGKVQWDLSALHPLLGSEGLLGFDQSPNHSVSLRFRATTECGFVSPSQVIFTSSAKQGCGIATNTLSKPGELLFIEGVTPLYNANISIVANAPPLVTCGDHIGLEVTLEADAITAGSDSVFILLPAGLSYVAGSYVPVSNAVNSAPIIDYFNGQFRLKWPLMANVQPFTPMVFSMELLAQPGLLCDSTEVKIVAFQRQEALCIANGELCTILAQTGELILPIDIGLPVLSLSNFQISASAGVATFLLNLENAGQLSTTPVVIEFYEDTDGSGDLSPGDVHLYTYTWQDGVPAGGSVLVSGAFNASYEQLCGLLAVVSAEDNCTCSEDVETVTGGIVNFLPPIKGCSDQPHEVGFPAVPGHTYQWEPSQGIGCETCSATVFQYENGTQNPVSVTLFLYDTWPNGCVIQNSQTLTLGGLSVVGEGQITHCEGDTLFFDPPAGSSETWIGPGIIGPNYVVFTEEGIYHQNIIDSFGCVSDFAFFVNLQASIVLDTVALCQGDSVVIDGVAYYGEVEVCDTIVTAQGCQVLECLRYEPRDTPFIAYPLDTICVPKGTEVVLGQLPENFAGYAWTPAGELSCGNCAHPSAPGLNATYYVTVTDANACTAQTEVTVLGLPACSLGGVEIPNVFTPNGDGVNDTFGPVLAPGIHKVVTSAHLRIFDRWGNGIFEGKGAGAQWDGNYKNQPMPSDVYAFMLEMTCSEDKVVVRGDVTLVR